MILETIEKILTSEEYPSTFIPPSEKFPFSRLYVILGTDQKEREKNLEIIAITQDLQPIFQLPPDTPLPSRIQFISKLPFKIEDIALNQVASLILFINQFIDLPGFELNELEGIVQYRYVWMTQEKNIGKIMLINILGSIQLTLSLFSELIESLSDGSKSFNDLLEEIIKIKENN